MCIENKNVILTVFKTVRSKFLARLNPRSVLTGLKPWNPNTYCVSCSVSFVPHVVPLNRVQFPVSFNVLFKSVGTRKLNMTNEKSTIDYILLSNTSLTGERITISVELLFRSMVSLDCIVELEVWPKDTHAHIPRGNQDIFNPILIYFPPRTLF